MKKILLLIVGISATSMLFAQKKGYKEFEVGANLQTINDQGKYSIKISNNKNEYFVRGGDSLRISNMAIDNIYLETDDNFTINEVRIYTKKVLFSNYDLWWANFKGVLDNVVNTVGKFNYTNLGKEVKIATAWQFSDTQSMLILRTDDAGTFQKDFYSNFLFIWSKLDHPVTEKMW